MTLIAEAYVHLRPFDETEEGLRRVAVQIRSRVPVVTEHIYGSSVDVGIRLQEGSLKTWVVVAGCIYAILDPIYNAISNYPDFKAGISELYRDAKKFGDSVSRLITEETQTSPMQVYRIERRTKTVGKIYRLTNAIDRLNRNKWRLGLSEYNRRLVNINKQVKVTLTEIDNLSDSAMVNSILSESGLPPLPIPRNDSLPRVLLEPKDENQVDWSSMPLLRGPALEPGLPKMRWATTIRLRDGREIILRP